MRAILLSLFCFITAPAFAAEPDPTGEPIEVMVIGTWHFKTSGADLINLDGPNVLEAERQQELAEVTSRLMAFEPTLVALERVTEAPAYIIESFQSSPPDLMATNPNERVQLGYRLATAADLDKVHGIDELSSEGEPDYFPFGPVMALAEETGSAEKIQTVLGSFEKRAGEEMAALSNMTMADALARVNEGFLSTPEFYFMLQRYDEGENQPAAELQAYWFMRNAKIWSKLLDVAEPGDRVVIIYGAGHKHWLDHLAENTPGVVLVDPVPYLRGD